MRRLVPVLALASCVPIPSGKVTDGTLRALDCVGSATCGQRPATVGARVWGRVVVEGPAGPQPLAYMRLSLRQGGTTVATASSDRSGAFLFQRNIEDGSYDLVLESDRYQGQIAVEVNGAAREIRLTAIPRPNVPRQQRRAIRRGQRARLSHRCVRSGVRDAPWFFRGSPR
jgi:hypothetical protein